MNRKHSCHLRFPRLAILVSGFLLLLPFDLVQAQPRPPAASLRIATRLVKPDVFQQDGHG